MHRDTASTENTEKQNKSERRMYAQGVNAFTHFYTVEY